MPWPASLPQRFNQPSDTVRPGEGDVLGFKTETGPGKRRRRSTATPRKVSGTMILTRAQYATFLDWFENQDPQAGALPFDWVDPDTGAPVQYQFDLQRPFVRQRRGTAIRLTLNLEQLR